MLVEDSVSASQTPQMPRLTVTHLVELPADLAAMAMVLFTMMPTVPWQLIPPMSPIHMPTLATRPELASLRQGAGLQGAVRPPVRSEIFLSPAARATGGRWSDHQQATSVVNRPARCEYSRPERHTRQPPGASWAQASSQRSCPRPARHDTWAPGENGGEGVCRSRRRN